MGPYIRGWDGVWDRIGWDGIWDGTGDRMRGSGMG